MYVQVTHNTQETLSLSTLNDIFSRRLQSAMRHADHKKFIVTHYFTIFGVHTKVDLIGACSPSIRDFCRGEEQPAHVQEYKIQEVS
jgi:hypothetical protein